MRNPLLAGHFDSVYNVRDDNGHIKPIADTIEFVIVDGTVGSLIRGRGMIEDDGSEMRLEVRRDGDNYDGTWKEVNQDGQKIYAGDLTFAAEDEDNFAGKWEMQIEDETGNPELTVGSWKLTRSLGDNALKWH